MSPALPPEAYAAALAGISLLGPARLERLLDAWPPELAWARIEQGKASGVWGRGEPATVVEKAGRAIETSVERVDPGRTWARCQALGVKVLLRDAPAYPAVLAADLAPPPVLFALGDLGALEARLVTIVGTRNATAAGREVAAELGAGLAGARVGVVSGLARGVDGWAHRGALSADGGGPLVGVVASGLDVVYPPEHRSLWADVAQRGVLLSEVPPGTRPLAARFPLRNRILAALGEVVVVVESKHKGGSLLTVDEALLRGRTVYAVPGSPRNPSAEGTNQLLLDGASPVVSSHDLLLALGFERPEFRAITERAGPRVQREDRWALELLGGEPRHLDSLVHVSGRSLVEVASALGRLEEAGAVRQHGGWFERRSRSARSAR